MKDSIASIANKYLKLSNYNIDSKTFQLQLETHPEYPSLKSISDTFDYFDIENIVAQVPKDVLNQLPETFLTTLATAKGLQVFLVKKSKDKIEITNENLEKKKITLEKFNKIWTGTIIAIEEAEQKETKTFSIGKLGLLLFAIMGVAVLQVNSSFNLINQIYSLTFVIGAIFSYYIVQEDLGIHNKIVSKVCETISKSDGCKGVITDQSSKLFSIVSLSDLTVIYFTTFILTLATVGHNSSILFVIACCSIPVILYSVYFQAVKLKKWCVLCIAVSTILITQFIFIYISFDTFSLDLRYLIQLIFITTLIAVLWFTFKSFYIRNNKLQNVEIDFLRFKRDKELFYLLLKKDKLTEQGTSLGKNRITFGSDNPKLIIDAITNPLCGYCAPSFQSYYKILEKSKDVQLNLIFNSFTNDSDNPGIKISIAIISIYHNEGKTKALNALKEWFDYRDYYKWINKYGVENLNKESDLMNIITNHQSWIMANEIYHTPVTIVNDYYYPKNYNIEDLILFADDMQFE